MCGLYVRLTQIGETQGYFLCNLSRIVDIESKLEVL